MKKCPYCAEDIQDAAVKCKHCMEFLDASKRPAWAGAPGGPSDTLPWYSKTAFIVMTFVMIPPFALPLVWLHPKWHPVVKLLLSLVILGVCWVVFYAFSGFVSQFDEATRMMNEMKL